VRIRKAKDGSERIKEAARGLSKVSNRKLCGAGAKNDTEKLLTNPLLTALRVLDAP